MTTIRDALLLCIGLGLLGACRSEPDPPAPTEPWPAPAAPGAAPPSPEDASEAAPPPTRSPYRVQTGSLVNVALPAKEARPTGTFRIVRGVLELDLTELGRSSGTIEVDLGSILMQGGSERREQQYTKQAREWLNLGASRPDAELERARLARFVVSGLEGLSHPAPHLGRKLAPEAGADASQERRRVSFTAVGELEANGVRVQRRVALHAEFHYPAAASPGLAPSRVRLTSSAPLVIPLAEHEVVPRDAHGRLNSAQLDLLGRLVGRNAQLTVQILALP